MCKTCVKHDKTHSDTPQGLYVILALTFWYYPGNSSKSVPCLAYHISNYKQLPQRNLHRDLFVAELARPVLQAWYNLTHVRHYKTHLELLLL